MSLLIVYIILWICFSIFIILGCYGLVLKLYRKYKVKWLAKDFKEKLCEYIEGPQGIALKLANKDLKFRYEIQKKKIFPLFKSIDSLNKIRYDLMDKVRDNHIIEFAQSKYNMYVYYEIMHITK